MFRAIVSVKTATAFAMLNKYSQSLIAQASLGHKLFGSSPKGFRATLSLSVNICGRQLGFKVPGLGLWSH